MKTSLVHALSLSALLCTGDGRVDIRMISRAVCVASAVLCVLQRGTHTIYYHHSSSSAILMDYCSSLCNALHVCTLDTIYN